MDITDIYDTIGVILGVFFTLITILASLVTLDNRFNWHLKNRITYWVKNKKFYIKISSTRKYPKFEFQTLPITNKIEDYFISNNKKIDYVTNGKNFIQILFENAQAPYLIWFTPEINDYMEEERTEVYIRLLGTVNFRYNEDNNNKNHLDNIESMYKIIETYYNINPSFEDYNLLSTSVDFNENWNTVKRKDVESGTVFIGSKVLNIHINMLSKLYDVYKQNITQI